MNKYGLITFLALSCGFAGAQVANPQPLPSRPAATTTVAAPASMSAIGAELNNALSQLERAAQQTSNDVGRLSIKKWKTESGYKAQSQHDVESIQTDVSGTMTQLLSQVRSNPDNIATLFKLYRNVDALYDVLKTLAESAGAFGPKGEYETLSADSRDVAIARNALAAQMDAIASNKEIEVSRLRTQVAQARAAVAVAPPKKVIVDDTETPKKPVKKKKAVAKPKTSEQSESQPQAAPPPKQ